MMGEGVKILIISGVMALIVLLSAFFHNNVAKNRESIAIAYGLTAFAFMFCMIRRRRSK